MTPADFLFFGFSRHPLEKGLGAFSDLLFRQIPLVRGDHPRIAERVLDRPRTVPPKHVGHRHDRRPAGVDGLSERRIRIRHVNVGDISSFFL